MTGLRSVAALYDIHGNLPALEAVLAELKDDRPEVVMGFDGTSATSSTRSRRSSRWRSKTWEMLCSATPPRAATRSG